MQTTPRSSSSCAGSGAFGRSKSLLTARFPKPDVRDLLRRLPARSPITSNVGSGATDSSETPDFLGETQATEPIQQIPQPPQPRRLEPLSADRYGVHFTADTEFRDLLERVRALASHRLPSGDLKTVLQRGLEVYERELLKGRFAVGKKPRPSNRERSSTAPSAKTYRSRQRRRASKPSRYVPAAAAREVYARDGGQCTFVSSAGRRCGAFCHSITSTRTRAAARRRPRICGFAAEPTTFGTLAVVSEDSALPRVLVAALPSELQTPLTPPIHRRTRRRDQ